MGLPAGAVLQKAMKNSRVRAASRKKSKSLEKKESDATFGRAVFASKSLESVAARRNKRERDTHTANFETSASFQPRLAALLDAGAAAGGQAAAAERAGGR